MVIEIPGMQDALDAVRALGEGLADVSELHRDVGEPFARELARHNLETQGTYTGPSWAFAATGETIYLGQKVASGADPRPLYWKPGEREELVPSLVDASHPRAVSTFAPGRSYIGSSARNAAATLGGTNPRTGERYPARDPFRTTPELQAVLARRYAEALARRLRARGVSVEVVS